MLLPPQIPGMDTLFEKVKMLLIRQLVYLQMCLCYTHNDPPHSARLECNFSPGERAKNTLTLLKSNNKNVFKRLFDLNKRCGTHGVKDDQKEHREVAQQKRKID